MLRRTSLVVTAILVGMVSLNNYYHWQSVRQAANQPQREHIYQLSYTIDLPNAAPGVGSRQARGAEKIFQEMRAIYLEWTQQHPELLQSVSQQTVFSYNEMLRPVRPENGEAQVRIELALDEGEFEPGLLDELTTIFTEVPEVKDCTVNRFQRESGVIFDAGEDADPDLN